MPVAASTDSIQNLILTILAVVIIIVAVWSIYAFIRAVFIYFPNEKRRKSKAWNSIRYMIMGIFLSVFILFMFPLVFKRVWVDNHEEYSAKNIFNKAWTIINKTFKLKDIVKESQKRINMKVIFIMKTTFQRDMLKIIVCKNFYWQHFYKSYIKNIDLYFYQNIMVKDLVSSKKLMKLLHKFDRYSKHEKVFVLYLFILLFLLLFFLY